MALLPMTGHWAGRALVEGEIPFPAIAQTVGFGLVGSLHEPSQAVIVRCVNFFCRHRSMKHELDDTECS